MWSFFHRASLEFLPFLFYFRVDFYPPFNLLLMLASIYLKSGNLDGFFRNNSSTPSIRNRKCMVPVYLDVQVRSTYEICRIGEIVEGKSCTATFRI